MEFELLKKSHVKRNIIIGILVVGIISAVILNFSKAKYRTMQSIPLVNGTINYTLADLNITELYIDGVLAEELDSSKNYTLNTKQSTCTYKNGTAISNLTLSYDSDTQTFTIAPYTTKGTKCTLYFEERKSATDTIESLYPDNQNMLAYDERNNLRYIGANPNNYVLFNNELWRIIGVFNEDSHGISGKKLIKIIRNDSIGYFSWDNKPSGTGSSIDQDGSNDWSDSALQEVLNSGAYWNRTSGTCPYGPNGVTKNCDFSTTGLTDTAKEMIETVTWKLGGINTSGRVTVSMVYSGERGTNVYNNRPTVWEGKVGLIYLSDYHYATNGGSTQSRETCLSELNMWYSEVSSNYRDCVVNDWLRDFTNIQWTITPNSSYNYVYTIIPTGQFGNNRAVIYQNMGYWIVVRPSVYLSSSVYINSGSGTSTDPYVVS